MKAQKEKEFNDYLKRLEEFSKQITSSATKSEKFLKNSGIYSAKGKLQPAFKDLCIPAKQD